MINLTRPLVRSFLLYDYKSDMKAAESSRRINDAFGEDTVSERTAQEWFAKFRTGDFSVEDRERSGRPSEVDRDLLCELLKDNPRQTARELGEKLGVHNTNVIRHLHELGMVHKLQQWVPHQLTESNRACRVDIAVSLLSQRPTNAWLDSVVTGDEKWCLYVNERRRRAWVKPDEQPPPLPKPGLHPRKIMLCVWWNSRGVIHFELLPPNQTINAEYYCHQLERLADKLGNLRPPHRQVRFLHDNARPHVARQTRQKLLELQWEVLLHPPYSPDIAPSDYHLFRSLDNAIQGQQFADEVELNEWLANFFASKPREFYRDGIYGLPERWQKIIDNDGDYF